MCTWLHVLSIIVLLFLIHRITQVACSCTNHATALNLHKLCNALAQFVQEHDTCTMCNCTKTRWQCLCAYYPIFSSWTISVTLNASSWAQWIPAHMSHSIWWVCCMPLFNSCFLSWSWSVIALSLVVVRRCLITINLMYLCRTWVSWSL